MKLYNVALTVHPDTVTHNWQVRAVKMADGFCGSSMIGNALLYVAHGIVAASEAAARSAALQMWQYATTAHLDTMTLPVPTVTA